MDNGGEELGFCHIRRIGFETYWQVQLLIFMWKEHFRVMRETFEYICDLVRLNLQKQHTRFRVPVSVEERVGLALWRLATGNSYGSYGLKFRLGKSTAKIICSEFENAILELKD